MFNYLRGEIAFAEGSVVVLDVNGVGYELSVSDFTKNDCVVGQQTLLYTYLQVKEDGVCLYGFSTKEEKTMFSLLISVSGVGCKVAQSVLSSINSSALATAIFNGDTKQLTKIKGLGKKTAERLVLELREKVVVNAEAITQEAEETETTLSKDMQDAIAILCSLGKNRADAEKLIEAASKLGANTATELVNMALRIG